MYNSSTVPLQHNKSFITVKADSGASKHYFRKSDIACLTKITPIPGPSVYLPDMTAIKITHKGTLPINNLSQHAKTVNILPELKSSSLLSLGQLCDDNCQVLLQKQDLRVFKNNKTIIKGKRNLTDGLWDVNIPSVDNTNVQKISVIIHKNTSKRDLVQFYHAACFSPSKATFIKAIRNGNFQSWPGLTTSLVRKFLDPTIATHFGHLNQERMNLQSTQQSSDDDFNPPHELLNLQTNEMIATVTEFKITSKAFGDLPGKFPITSSRGTQYVLVIYHYNSNAILVRPLKNRTGKYITEAYLSIYNILKTRGIAPKTFILDNETSNVLLNAFEKEGIKC